MNSKKIAFIVCVNNELYFEECNWYLNRLIIPEDFEIDIITVREAKSMAEAYNAAMESSDAKYKVYLHQDVFIINQNFISDMLNVFRTDHKIGMLGLIGGVKIPESGVIYNAWNCGRTIASDYSSALDIHFYQKEPYIYVEALDGMLLATQYDIRWREDILKQWDFYDISQSFEFLRAGYRIVIPFQDPAWAIHDCGYSNLVNYDDNRKIMFDAYPDFLTEKWTNYPFIYSYELHSLTKQLYVEIENLINQKRYKEAEILLCSFDENEMVKNMPILRQVFEISNLERETLGGEILLELDLSTSELLERYTRIKFFLRRLEIREKIEIEDILKWIHINKVSPMEIIISIIHNLTERKFVFDLIEKTYRLGNEDKNARIMEAMSKKIEERNLNITNKEDVYITRKRIEADYWSNYKENPNRTRWWQSQTIIRHYNKKICGKAIDGWNNGAIELLKEKNLIPVEGIERAISIGCGSAQKEIRLLKEGVVKHFTCIDIAEGMIKKARENARKNEVEHQMEFMCGDIYSLSDKDAYYDLVFWDNSLHHMEDADKAVEISYNLLKRGGLFFCNDFIGNNRFQWSDMQMAIVNGIRLYLAEDYFNNADGSKFTRFLNAPSIQQMMNTDPSEAADSESIVPAVKKYFIDHTIINTGGLVYHLCLEDILQNMPEESEILEYMLDLDNQTIDFGLSLYAFIFAIKDLDRN
ncbi:glycosyltransferase [Clostridium sp. Marseille-P299]|uniref:glycosyltransferase n=1 Tax=Clostridium sp. Marseille-P299 TaxID=1805477 RepID=UPI0009ED15AE|nr:glycosyltransferase [Clostridium sp. Marseille-P299]